MKKEAIRLSRKRRRSTKRSLVSSIYRGCPRRLSLYWNTWCREIRMPVDYVIRAFAIALANRTWYWRRYIFSGSLWPLSPLWLWQWTFEYSNRLPSSKAISLSVCIIRNSYRWKYSLFTNARNIWIMISYINSVDVIARYALKRI